MASKNAVRRSPVLVGFVASLLLVTDVGPTFATHAGTPQIALRPACGTGGPDAAPVTVRGSGFNGHGFVQVTFDGVNVVAGPTDAVGSFTLTFTPLARPRGSYEVAATEIRDPGRQPPTGGTGTVLPQPPIEPRALQQVAPLHRATATFVMPCPVVTTVPTTAPTTTTTSTTTPSVVRTTTTTRPFRPDVVITTTTVPTTVTTVPTPGAAPVPVLQLVPPIGPPGFVTTAVGANFTPNVEVRISWAPGLGGARATPDATGQFRVPLLLFRHDALGLRRALANAADGGSASAGFLVVAPSGQPPGFVVRG